MWKYIQKNFLFQALNFLNLKLLLKFSSKLFETEIIFKIFIQKKKNYS